jgi:hypothetical protein
MAEEVRPPYWQMDGRRETAYGLDNLTEDWSDFVEWVNGLPDRFVQLKALARSGRATDRTALGRELLDAWQAHRGDENQVGMAVDALADGLVWRVVQWGKANDYQPPPDPAELVLFGD